MRSLFMPGGGPQARNELERFVMCLLFDYTSSPAILLSICKNSIGAPSSSINATTTPGLGLFGSIMIFLPFSASSKTKIGQWVKSLQKNHFNTPMKTHNPEDEEEAESAKKNAKYSKFVSHNSK